MTVTKERAMQMFDRDLEILLDDLRGMQAHYQIAEWEAFVFIRKPDCPESYVAKYAAADDTFAKQIVQLHAATPPDTPSDAVLRAAKDVVNEILNVPRFVRNPEDTIIEIENKVATIITRHLAGTTICANCERSYQPYTLTCSKCGALAFDCCLGEPCKRCGASLTK